MAALIKFHEVDNDGGVSPVRYVTKRDVHRIDACEKGVPAYDQGVRAFIRGRGKDAFLYRAHETAEELAAQMESA